MQTSGAVFILNGYNFSRKLWTSIEKSIMTDWLMSRVDNQDKANALVAVPRLFGPGVRDLGNVPGRMAWGLDCIKSFFGNGP